MEDKKKVLVVDLNNIWNKYLYVRKGMFDQTLGSILCFFKSIYTAKEFAKVFVVLDGTPSEKYNEYKDYKQNRKKNPDKYIPMKVLSSILSQYFTVIGGKRVEGDCVVAYVAKKLSSNYDTYIYSNDKDFLQLLQYGIKVINKFKNGKILEELTSEDALKKFKNSKGEPLKELKHILPYRVFKGDSSDNIPSACRGMLDVNIRHIVEHCWDYEDDIPLDEDRLMSIIGRIDDWKVRKDIVDNKNNILRNYKLMDLCHIPEDFKKEVQKIYYKIEHKAVETYNLQRGLYTW